jgi:predicted HNH restriction endonuclease
MPTKKCILCNEKIQEEYGKLKGTIIKVKDENKKTQFIPVCSDCQKLPDHIDNAKIKSA